jgi:hypothetical protein
MKEIAMKMIGIMLPVLGMALAGCSHYGDDNGECETGMEGVCGLAGTCIECFLHEHCEDKGGVCLVTGDCVAAGGAQCASDSDCPEGTVCADHLCVVRCTEQSECREGEKCNGTYCTGARCTEEGVCPLGWKTVEGSLSCTYAGIACGEALICDPMAQYCLESIPGQPGEPTTWDCVDLPEACKNADDPDCACIDTQPNCNCTEDPPDHFKQTCTMP